MKRVLFPLVLALGLAGCRETSAPSQPATSAPPPPPEAPGASLSPSARLALAKPTGTSPGDAAVATAQAGVQRDMTKDDAWILLGRAWVKKARESADPGFYLNADAAADVVLARSADAPAALDLRGLVLLNGHAFGKARELAADVVAKHPGDAMAWGTLSDALLELGRYDEAADAAQHMIDLKPNLPSYSRASHLQWLRGEVTASKRTARSALDAGRDAVRDPEPGAWMLVQAATIFWHEGDLEGAEAGCDEALRRMPSFAPANVCKGRVALARGNAKSAAELLGRAYEVSPLVETAWLLGDARAAAGDDAGAAKAWAMAERDGKTSDPRTLSLFWSTKNTNVASAVELAEKELATRADIYTEDALAWALHRAGRTAEAKQHIARARRLGTPDARLLYHEGAIRIRAGELAAGRKLVAAALEKNRAFDPTGAREAAELLASPPRVARVARAVAGDK